MRRLTVLLTILVLLTFTVTAGGSGDVAYRGVYDTSTFVATYLVRGRICIG